MGRGSHQQIQRESQIYQRGGTCSVSGCGRKHWGRTYCRRHYDRWYRNGDPISGRAFDGEALDYLNSNVISHATDDCLQWPYTRNSAGYGQLVIDGVRVSVTRYVCEQTYGPAPSENHQAAHSCGKGGEGCCSPAHLSWKTAEENEADKILHGTRAQGERHGCAKLTEVEVRLIRGMRGTKTHKEIGNRFGASKTQIGDILRGKSWASLK